MKRRFVIVYGDKGAGEHNVGSLFEWSATTHKSEVIKHTFPEVPALGDALLQMFHISSVPDLVKDIKAGNIEYLAYFGHSWTDDLFIGETATAGSNLASSRTETEAPVTDIPRDRFRADAQIRLFGCHAGFGTAPIASKLHDHLGVTVFAYSNSGGSMFTQDAKLGHGKRAVTQADIDFNDFKAGCNTWLVPINGVPRFRKF